ncbi:MAG: CPBP family intramembrane metalloprotease [Lachnospiraceae bacterium]|nr:CPBP family intramembrane metalloprotease [Lachnospiraceae bacterium]
MSWIFYVLSPVLLHLAVSEMITVLAGNVLDSAACTALSAVFVLPFALWMYRKDSSLHGKSVEIQAAAVLLSLAGGGLLNLLWSGLLNLMLNLFRFNSYFSNATQEALLTSSFIAQILGPGLLVPAAEELVFRGLTYTRMRIRMQTHQAVVLSAMLFALYHGNPIQMIYAFPMALLLAFLYEKSGNLAYPILFHMGANLTAIVTAIIFA